MENPKITLVYFCFFILITSEGIWADEEIFSSVRAKLQGQRLSGYIAAFAINERFCLPFLIELIKIIK